MSFIAYATFAVAAVQAVEGHESGKKQAASQSKLSQLQIDEANRALSLLGPSKKAKIDVAQEEYKFGAETLGMGKAESQQQLGTAIQKSGLVTSAGITQKKSSMWKQFEHAEKGLMGQLGKSMGGIEEWFEGETSRLSGEKKRAELQKKAFDKAAGAQFLGIDWESISGVAKEYMI